MRKFLKWVAYLLGGIVGLAMLITAVVYVKIGSELSTKFEVPTLALDIPDDALSIAEGQRLARIRGCFDGCHGTAAAGEVFFDLPDGTQVIAPDLGHAARNYTASELAAIIRFGIRPDGSSALLVMPSEMFYHVSDNELGAMIAFLKTQEPRDEPLPETRYGPLARLLLQVFKHETSTILAAEYVERDHPRISPAPHDPHEHGRYLAKTACTECHGKDLSGGTDGIAPPLAIALSYSAEEFATLMRTGIAKGGRELDLMKLVAEKRFSFYTDAEILALHTFLQSLAKDTG